MTTIDAMVGAHFVSLLLSLVLNSLKYFLGKLGFSTS